MNDLRSPHQGPDRQSERKALLAELVADPRPVRPVSAPWKRSLLWLSLVVVAAMVMAWFSNMPAVKDRLMAATNIWLAVAGSAMTAMLAGSAAFQLSSPDRTPRWAFLPLPGLAVWLTAGGMGCSRALLAAEASHASLLESVQRLGLIIGISVPLLAIILGMLRRGYSLYPALTGAMAGLGSSAAAATLLGLFHSSVITWTNLVLQAGGVVVVVGMTRALSEALLTPHPGAEHRF